MTDVIRVDVPTFLRLLELAREDVNNDMDLHDITQKVTELSQNDVVTMADYSEIVEFMRDQGQEFDSENPSEYDEMIENIRRLGGMNSGS